MQRCDVCGKISLIEGDMQGHNCSRCVSGLNVANGRISVPRSAEMNTYTRIEVPLGSILNQGKWKMKYAFAFVPSGTQPSGTQPSDENFFNNIGRVFEAIPPLFNAEASS